MAAEDLEQLIDQFVTVTSTSREVAEQYVVNNSFNVNEAIEDFFGNKPVAEVHASSSSASGVAGRASSNQVKKSKIKSFSDLNNDEYSGSDDETNLFTGGEKSALQVENPDKNNSKNLVRDLLKKAEEGGAQPEIPAPTKKFTGTGFKLGDENSPTVLIPDPSSYFKRPEKVTRNITFWKDGFQVGDGKLYRYDDPANESILSDLNKGTAPLSLLDVQFGQEVDVNVTKKLDEEYKPPKRKVGGFHGSGQRLGSPVPGESVSEPTIVETPKMEEKKEPAKPSIGGSGDATVQIRLANGERKVHKFDSTAPVTAIYNFVDSITSDSRSFILSHAFPVKPIANDQTTIKDAGLVNSVVIQRWS